jgi:hypothetical protein
MAKATVAVIPALVGPSLLLNSNPSTFTPFRTTAQLPLLGSMILFPLILSWGDVANAIVGSEIPTRIPN